MKTVFRVVSASLVLGGGFTVLSCVAESGDPGDDAPSPNWTSVDRDTPQVGDPFATVARVLRHPRCLNCHPSGDVPKVGDDRRLHAMGVRRGDHNFGMPAMHCNACHRSANQEAAQVPGAPHWQLAPRSMGWEGLDDHDLAETLKDRSKNGDRSLEDLLHHVSEDPLVLWGWDPGVGRSPPPISHAQFVKAFRHWIDSGAASPAPGTTSY